MSLTVEALELRLDGVVADALLRKRNALALAGVGKAETAAELAKTRAWLKNWRDRATIDALRTAPRKWKAPR